ncbi:MAG: class I SAM-dependent methyltransferase [Actinomycetia bacterium]|nr:class I SAM-dependent methyltransferase [Actinomycetes bacterium]
MVADIEPDASSLSHTLEDAYAVESPDDCIRLYQDWSASYEDDILTKLGYVSYLRVVEAFVEEASRDDGPVLDVGCGTGVVGAALALQGGWAVDGLDISPAMLQVAAEKLNLAGEPVFGSLIEADLTQPLPIASNTYGAVISAGTFTMGHVGPEALGELGRIVRPGGLVVLGVNTTFFNQQGFDRFLAALEGEVAVAETAIGIERSYTNEHHDHGADTVHVVTLRIADH